MGAGAGSFNPLWANMRILKSVLQLKGAAGVMCSLFALLANTPGPVKDETE